MYQWAGQTPQAIAVDAASHTEEITGLCEDAHGRIWVSTLGGRLGWIEASRFALLDERAGDECRALLQDQNGVFWIGFFGRVPALYSYEDGQFRPAVLAEAETIAYVHVLWEHEHALWIGTAEGLFILDYSSGQVRHVTADDSELSANSVLALAADQQGHVWIGTSGGGVVRYDGESFQSIRLGTSALGNVVEAIVCDHTGQLWFGTRAGLVAYQPSDTRPGLVIREVLAGRRLPMPEAVSCREDVEEIRIRCQGISFRSGAQQMRYRHRLVGYGPAAAWSAFSAAAEVAYRTLPVGDYRFEVQTIDRDDVQSAVVSLDLHILPDPQTKHLQILEKDLRASTPIVPSLSRAMEKVMQDVSQVVETDMSVLVLGETGTGKGVLAQTMHDMSHRREQPFIQVNCGSIPASLIESELFGHEKGSFTGAGTRQLGRFELAEGGTIFLDEIGNLPLELQRVLLHILEERTLTRVGGQRPVAVDVRVIAATNRDLAQAVEEDAFRSDLFYRLNGFTLELPPLRQRVEDIPALAEHFAVRTAHDLKRSIPILDDAVIAALQAHAWPGNIRELEHVIERAVLLCEGGVVRVEHLALLAEAGERPPAKRPVEAPPPTEAVDEKQNGGGPLRLPYFTDSTLFVGMVSIGKELWHHAEVYCCYVRPAVE